MHRLRCLRRHWRAPRRTGTHLTGVRQVHKAPLRGGTPGRRGEGGGAGGGREAAPHQPVHAAGEVKWYKIGRGFHLCQFLSLSKNGIAVF